VTLSFLLGAVACAFAGLCYAEMSSPVPISGSAYTYAYATMGEHPAMSVIRSLSGEKQTSRGHRVSVANDLSRTSVDLDQQQPAQRSRRL
jgi:hypothetical protein